MPYGKMSLHGKKRWCSSVTVINVRTKAAISGQQSRRVSGIESEALSQHNTENSKKENGTIMSVSKPCGWLATSASAAIEVLQGLSDPPFKIQPRAVDRTLTSWVPDEEFARIFASIILYPGHYTQGINCCICEGACVSGFSICQLLTTFG